MKKKISLKFLNEFCSSDVLQKKFLDYENNRVFFPEFSKKQYYEYFMHYYIGLLEEELSNGSFNVERFSMFYNNMIVNYTDRFSYYMHNEITDLLNNQIFKEHNCDVKDIVSDCYSTIYDLIENYIKKMPNLNIKYLSFRNRKMNHDDFEYISSKYLSDIDKIDFSYDLMSEIIENNYDVKQEDYLEIFKGFIQSEAKRLKIDTEIGYVFCEFTDDIIASHKDGLIKLNIKYLKSSNVVQNMISFYHELTHFLRDSEYLDDNDKLSMDIRKEEILLKYYDGYYNANYKNTFSEEEARFMSYKFLMNFIENYVPSKIEEVEKIIKKEFDRENVIEDDIDVRKVGNKLKPFDQVFDEFVKNNFDVLFYYPLVDDDVKDYIIHTYDCLGNRRSISNMKKNNNILGISEKTSKKELFKYLINLKNIKDSYYKEKLNDFFTEYTRMYLSYIINNIAFKQSNSNRNKYMDYVLSSKEENKHCKKLSKKSDEFIR